MAIKAALPEVVDEPLLGRLGCPSRRSVARGYAEGRSPFAGSLRVSLRSSSCSPRVGDTGG